MKDRQLVKCILILLIGWQSQISKSQNLVPNPSFEEYQQCPTFLGAVKSFNVNSSYGIVKEWMANPSYCTPDYYHACGKKAFKVPENQCGNISAFEGEGYIGMILRIGEVHIGSPSDLMYREHITTKLKKTLQKNYQYEVKFHINLATYSNFAIANFGALLTEEPWIIKENIAFEPQILSEKDVYLTEKEHWQVICDTFVAKGGERFITLGNFDNYKNRKIKKIDNSKTHLKKFNFNRAYYFIDEISVEEIGEAPPNEALIEVNNEIESPLGNLQKGKNYILQNVFFDFDKADLLAASFAELDTLVSILNENPWLSIHIYGHTDEIGTATDNQLLSENRAKSVGNYLISKGIDKQRLQMKGFGEAQPIEINSTSMGRQKNRRVEFVLY